jgi:N-acetyl-gamma-glutamyl-phosphate reductase
MVRVAVTGATGLVGECLVRLLVSHPEVEVTYLGSNSSAGRNVAEVLPSLAGCLDLTCCAPDVDAICRDADVAILAHKSAESLVLTPRLLEGGLKVIDIGGEFRLKVPGLYKQWYGQDHTAPDLLNEAVYGLPELYREKIKTARLVANPGCYPTSVVLALAPLMAKDLLVRDSLRISSSSGLSGAGRTSGKLFIDINEDMRAYALAGHKHRPEMEQELSVVAGGKVAITFVPHIVPVTRGILSTVFARPAGNVNQDRLRQVMLDRYADEPFVRVRESGGEVCMSNVRGTNFCDVAVEYIASTNDVIVMSSIDNMLKGACTQAIQNLNLMCGFDESTGIDGVRGS